MNTSTRQWGKPKKQEESIQLFLFFIPALWITTYPAEETLPETRERTGQADSMPVTEAACNQILAKYEKSSVPPLPEAALKSFAITLTFAENEELKTQKAEQMAEQVLTGISKRMADSEEFLQESSRPERRHSKKAERKKNGNGKT